MKEKLKKRNYSPLFCDSVSAFNEKFNGLTDPKDLCQILRESRVADMSGIDALNI